MKRRNFLRTIGALPIAAFSPGLCHSYFARFVEEPSCVWYIKTEFLTIFGFGKYGYSILHRIVNWPINSMPSWYFPDAFGLDDLRIMLLDGYPFKSGEEPYLAVLVGDLNEVSKSTIIDISSRLKQAETHTSLYLKNEDRGSLWGDNFKILRSHSDLVVEVPRASIRDHLEDHSNYFDSSCPSIILKTIYSPLLLQHLIGIDAADYRYLFEGGQGYVGVGFSSARRDKDDATSEALENLKRAGLDISRATSAWIVLSGGENLDISEFDKVTAKVESHLNQTANIVCSVYVTKDHEAKSSVTILAMT